MEKASNRKVKNKPGIRLLLERYKALFRTDENRKHYSEEDYRQAERKFLKYALEQRMIEIQEERFK
jgi:tryptophanyl-tRNA synthetase